MNTNVEKCKKMGGLRREFARLKVEQINKLNIARRITKRDGRIFHISYGLSNLPRSRFKFKDVKFRGVSSDES